MGQAWLSVGPAVGVGVVFPSPRAEWAAQDGYVSCTLCVPGLGGKPGPPGMPTGKPGGPPWGPGPMPGGGMPPAKGGPGSGMLPPAQGRAATLETHAENLSTSGARGMFGFNNREVHNPITGIRQLQRKTATQRISACQPCSGLMSMPGGMNGELCAFPFIAGGPAGCCGVSTPSRSKGPGLGPGCPVGSKPARLHKRRSCLSAQDLLLHQASP